MIPTTNGQLVLSRRKNQTIVIGDGPDRITITVTSAAGTVRLGVQAPRSIPVHRGEVFDDIQAGNKRKHP